jgi:glycosyltransferase involved in cell wall biosynthesis
MPPPSFSVATPTRNALAQLRRCVGSVRGQQGVSVEHLVQDANSSDGTPAWLQHQAEEHSGFQPVSCADGGMYDAIQRAWSRSQGRYLSWLNADEQYLPGTLARVQAFFEAEPDVDVVSGDYLVVDDSGRAIALRRELPLRRFFVVNSFLNTLSCTLFFRRRLLDQGLLRFDSQLRYAADMDMVLKLDAAGVKFRHLPEVLSMFGVDGSNLSTHAGMQAEAEALRLAHGGFRAKPLRALPLMVRRLERLARGAYGRRDFEYEFALDEVPNYARYRATALGGRYSLADTQGKAERLDLARTALTNH